MKQIISFLKQLDLSNTEIKIYLKLLSSGPLTVSELAEKIKMNRTAIYPHTNLLLKKGIITKVKGTTNKIAANSPDILYTFVDQKLNTANLLNNALPSIVNKLTNYTKKQQPRSNSEIKYYKGVTGVKSIYQDCLKADVIRCYYNPKDLEDYFPENFDLFYTTLKNDSRMRMYEICGDTPTARRRSCIEKNLNHYWKFLPPGTILLANDILMYDGKVAIINLRSKDSIEGIIIQNKDYYDNSVQIYDVLWKLLPNITNK